MIGNRLVEVQLAGHDPPLPGNRHPRWAPQGVYPCAGDDRWVAVSVADDGAWRALVDEVGLPAPWAGWTEEQRRAAHDQIDDALSTWTAEREHREVAGRLQAVGVPAAPVVDGAELVDDPHLAARDAFVELTHPDCGTHSWPRLPVRLDRTPAGPGRPAPLLGEHNREVLTGWAGLSDGELAALEARGVVATEPPG
jgi:crotonobetainyl-CoA:carnitine CoA-transferase CaiB-like acyl-CoA transferase